MTNYYNWIRMKIGSDSQGRSFSHLLTYLQSVEFYPMLLRDVNRFSDGVDLRYLYAYEFGIPYEEIDEQIDRHHCSMLEMMAALAIRIEEDTMYNYLLGDRTYIWFWDMVRSLGLYRYDDRHWTEASERELDTIVHRFMTRTYSRNGAGGLVTTTDPTIDMPSLEIWDQMNVYMHEYLEAHDE